MASLSEQARLEPGPLAARLNAWMCGVLGCVVLTIVGAVTLSLLTWNVSDPSLTHAASGPVRNVLGPIGAIVSDLVMQLLGLAGVFVLLPLTFWALQLIGDGRLERPRVKLLFAPLAVLLLACAASSLPKVEGWPLDHNIGGLLGDLFLSVVTSVLARIRPERASVAAGLFCVAGGMLLLMTSMGLSRRDLKLIFTRPKGFELGRLTAAWRRLGEMPERSRLVRREPSLHMPASAFPPAPAFGPHPPSSCEAHGNHAPVVPRQSDDEDPSQFERIVRICAPKAPARKADANERPVLLLPPEPAPVHDRQYQAEPPPPRPAPRSVARPQPPAAAPCPHGGPQYGGATWPMPEPVAPRTPPMPPPADGWRPQSLPGGDDLYGRAVAIVLDDRKASADYLQQRLQIGYMRAIDLIERMEREGILGAPVYNGLRPILIGGHGSREI